jgi:GNAT superfamily N-acetyltransferase
MKKFTIKIAQESDTAEIYKFKAIHFDTSEPVRLSHVGGICGPRDIRHLLENVKTGTVLMAIEESSNNLVGVSICKPIHVKSEELKLKDNEIKDQRLEDLMNFFIYVQEKDKIFERLNIEEYFYIAVVSVHSAYRGQRIATKLFEASFELAKVKGFNITSVDCSSVYTSKIAENLGMELMTTVTYDEYNNYLGKQLFISKEPHNDIRSYYKRQ